MIMKDIYPPILHHVFYRNFSMLNVFYAQGVEVLVVLPQ